MSFIRVSPFKPCPICKKPDWCRVFSDGWAECMRVHSDRPAKSGGWMHRHPDAPQCFLAPPLWRPQPPALNATKLHWEWRAETSQGALEGLASELGVSTMALNALGAAWAPQRAAWAFPMRDGYNNIVGIRLRSAQGKFAVRGSRQGIFTATAAPQPVLYVCEGPTDTAAALDLGLFAVGRPNCCCGGLDIKLYHRRYQITRVVIVSDNDKPGLDGARKVGTELQLSFAVYVPPAKDLREFVRFGGTATMIENTLKSALWTL